MILNNKIDSSLTKIKFRHTKNILHNIEAYSVIDEIIGEAIIEDDKGKEKAVGEIIAHQIDLATIFREEASITDILDEHSHSMSEFIPFFSDNFIFKKIVFETLNLKIDTDLDETDALILDNLYVEKNFRGEHVSQILINSLCNDYRRKGRFAFLKAFPLQFSNSKDFVEFSEEKKKKVLKEKEEFKNRSFEESQEKLISLYNKCGFKLIKGETEFMVHDLWERDIY